MTDSGEIESPCNGVCEMNPTTRYCLGCFRTRDEIVEWDKADSVRRKEILGALIERRGELY